MYVYAELSPRVSEGSDASRKYVLESGKSPEFQSKHGEVQTESGVLQSSRVNTERCREVWNPLQPLYLQTTSEAQPFFLDQAEAIYRYDYD